MMGGPPVRIVKRLSVDLVRRYAVDKTVRSIESNSEFDRLYQALLDKFLNIMEIEHTH